MKSTNLTTSPFSRSGRKHRLHAAVDDAGCDGRLDDYFGGRAGRTTGGYVYEPEGVGGNVGYRLAEDGSDRHGYHHFFCLVGRCERIDGRRTIFAFR